MRLLIADDDPMLQKLYRKIAQRYGLTIVAMAGNGEEAVRMYSEYRDEIDIVLLDHQMPRKCGVDAAREIMASDCRAIIVLATGDYIEEQAAIQAGFRAWIQKPFMNDALVCLLEETWRSTSALPATIGLEQ